MKRDYSLHEDIHRALEQLCHRALRGELGLDEFHASWPRETLEDPFFQQLFDDVEDGVEHLPGHLFTGRTDFRAWTGSYEYRLILLDRLLLESRQGTEQLMKCRDHIIQSGLLEEIQRGLVEEAVIRESVERCLGEEISE
jgi:hypothetical protein